MAILPDIPPIKLDSKLISETELMKYPQFAPNGVYILHMDGKLYLPEWWTAGSENVVGVALITDQCRFVIAPRDFGSHIVWYDKNDIHIPTVFTIRNSDADLIKTDFGGKDNTRNAMSFLYELDLSGDSDHEYAYPTNYALGYCYMYKFRNGKTGYLGAIGEMWAIYQNLAAVNDALERINGQKFEYTTSATVAHWSSTQSSSGNAWGVMMDRGQINAIKKDYSGSNVCIVRPLCPLD